MKFGSVENPQKIDFTLPEDHHDSEKILKQGKGLSDVFIGCAKWNRQDLKKFYPRGTKDELAYYSTQFNSIELNATFYNQFRMEQIEKWVDKTPEHFKFFPKVHRMISHIKRLNHVEESIEMYASNIRAFGKKLGRCFLQLHDSFKPAGMDRLVKAIEFWPKDIPLAVELRNTEWFNDSSIANEVYSLFEDNGISNIVTDTAGRRDLLHMRLTTTDVFVRYVGANHESDYSRLDDWMDRIKRWSDQGMENLYFFVHQNLEKESPVLSAYIISKMNNEMSTKLKVPVGQDQQTLFGN
ncbi:MAG: DUF72 domain-containing protein [Ekhidna sp.]|nr:DUF72 domain-containing protein [Ekhidna sp.]MBC6425022.1 DUF72 domain-containing protein [Ekhidna sp.]